MSEREKKGRSSERKSEERKRNNVEGSEGGRGRERERES